MKEIVTSQPADSGGSIPIIDNVFQRWSPEGVVKYNRLLWDKVNKPHQEHHVSGIECNMRNLELFKNLSNMKERRVSLPIIHSWILSQF